MATMEVSLVVFCDISIIVAVAIYFTLKDERSPKSLKRIKLALVSEGGIGPDPRF